MATIFKFKRDIPEGRKLPPQAVIIFNRIKEAKSITREQLCELLEQDIKNNVLVTVQEPVKLIAFYQVKFLDMELIEVEKDSTNVGRPKKDPSEKKAKKSKKAKAIEDLPEEDGEEDINAPTEDFVDPEE